MTSDDQQNFVMSNQHEFRFIPPNRCNFLMIGTFVEADVHAYVEFLNQHADRHQILFDAIFDISRLERLTEGARSAFMSITRPFPLNRVALVGASFSIRVMSSMVIRAGRLVAPDKWAFAYEFFSTIDDAEAWLNRSPRSRR